MKDVRGTGAGAIAVAVALLCWGGCSRPSLPRGTPVIVISLDTLRSDRLSCYGARNVSTPSLDRFADDAVLYERAYSHCPLTLPSHASILTGLLPPEHGVRNNRDSRLPDDPPTLAERLREQGYRTGGVVSSMVLRRQTGIARGFEDWDDEMGAGAGIGAFQAFAERRGDRSVDRALGWLDGIDSDRPFFLFLHLFDPHTPYEAPEPYASQQSDPYDAEVAWTDAVVGRFLDALRERGLYDRALIVILSDHGEGLGDHVESEHGLLLYREAIQVPLLIRLPGGQRGGERVDLPVALVDVKPTVLDLLGFDREGLPGRSLLRDGPPPPAPVYAETLFTRFQYGWAELRSVIDGELHYIEAPRPELYDLLRDPAERHNLLPERELPERMLAWLESIGRGFEATAELTQEELRQLAALGYVGGARVAVDDEAPDPKDRIAVAEDLWASAEEARASGSLEAVRRIQDRFERLGIRNESLVRQIASNLMGAGHARAALEVLRPFGDSREPQTMQFLGSLRMATGDLAGALERFRAALQAEPRYSRALYGMGAVLELRGDDGGAAERYRAALDSEPGYAPAHLRLAHCLRRSGDPSGALEHYRAVLAVDPRDAEARLGDAMTLVGSGRWDEARASLERAVELLPEQPAFAHALARLLVAAPDENVRDGRRGAELLDRVSHESRNTDVAESIAMALAESRRYDEAAEWQRRAIEAARASGRRDLARKMMDNLRAYEQGRPCRTPWREDDPIHVPDRDPQPVPP